MNRSKRKQMAEETLRIVREGQYLVDERVVRIGDEVKAAVDGARVFQPSDLERLPSPKLAAHTERVQSRVVVNETTLAAAQRLVQDEGLRPLCLNFASAKNPGGGFLNGSEAQEESLARSSALYDCISPQRAYYDANRACGTPAYTHHMIYSPQVPVFRDDEGELLATPYCASFVTAPAPNRGAMRKQAQRMARVEQVMVERMDCLLTLASHLGYETLVLGAWGCGVFRNDPALVADWFDHVLRRKKFAGVFGRVHFAVLDRSEQKSIFREFEQSLAT